MAKSSNPPAWAMIRSLCLALPETSETSSWGHPNFRAGKRTFVTLEWVKGRPSIAFRATPDQVTRLLTRKNFFETPYGRGQWVSVWADAQIETNMLKTLVDRSYRV